MSVFRLVFSLHVFMMEFGSLVFATIYGLSKELELARAYTALCFLVHNQLHLCSSRVTLHKL